MSRSVIPGSSAGEVKKPAPTPRTVATEPPASVPAAERIERRRPVVLAVPDPRSRVRVDHAVPPEPLPDPARPTEVAAVPQHDPRDPRGPVRDDRLAPQVRLGGVVEPLVDRRGVVGEDGRAGGGPAVDREVDP